MTLNLDIKGQGHILFPMVNFKMYMSKPVLANFKSENSKNTESYNFLNLQNR